MQRGIKSRAIVHHDGRQDGDGIWTCSKDPLGRCAHIKLSKDHLQKLLRCDPLAADTGDSHAAADVPGACCGIRTGDDDILVTLFLVRRASLDDESISHLPILPPIWASLPSDPKLYDHLSPLRASPSLITLDETSSCLCRAKYVAADSSTVVQKPCVIYGLTELFQSCIQLQSCPACSPSQRRFIGPDGRNLGIFNYNNRILFTHELLNDYTSAYTSSETPFTAWVSVVSR
jgi:hypothetical protein